VISIHLSFSPSTEKLIDTRELGWMKRDVTLVSTWRGAVLDAGQCDLNILLELTQGCVLRLAVEVVQSALTVLEGKRPNGIVTPEVLNHPSPQTFS